MRFVLSDVFQKKEHPSTHMPNIPLRALFFISAEADQTGSTIQRMCKAIKEML